MNYTITQINETESTPKIDIGYLHNELMKLGYSLSQMYDVMDHLMDHYYETVSACYKSRTIIMKHSKWGVFIEVKEIDCDDDFDDDFGFSMRDKCLENS